MHKKSYKFEKTSVSGLNWRYKEQENKNFHFLKKKINIANSLAKIILERYPNIKDLELLINSSLKESLPNPETLKDLEKVVNLIIPYLNTKNKVGLLGDYDVDGCSSAALVHNYFLKVGISTRVYIPDRLRDGYGVSKRALDYFCKNKIELLITLDCGTNDYELINYAYKKGLKVIVIDHHEVKTKAKACGIINPKQDDDHSNLNHLSTVGLCFIFIIGLHNKLIDTNFFQKENMPDLRFFLDMVAMGTICDLVPIKGLNRIFVKKGLSVINRKCNKGLKVLAEKLELKSKITEDDLGYYLGPCINAAGRIGKSQLAFELLTENKKNRTEEIAEELIRNNKERKTLEEISYRQAINIIKKERMLSSNKNMFILIENRNWHPGITGIIASKLLEKFNLPCFIISSYGKKSRGSLRTPYSIDASKLLKRLLDEHIIVSGGGHKLAGGFVIKKENLKKLKEQLFKECKNFSFSKKNYLKIDAITDISKINKKFMEGLDILGPFGIQNNEPTFVIENVKPLFFKIVGKDKNHISCIIEDVYGLKIKAIAFNAIEKKIYQPLLEKNNIHVAGKIKINEWNSKQDIQMIIDDIMVA